MAIVDADYSTYIELLRGHIAKGTAPSVYDQTRLIALIKDAVSRMELGSIVTTELSAAATAATASATALDALIVSLTAKSVILTALDAAACAAAAGVTAAAAIAAAVVVIDNAGAAGAAASVLATEVADVTAALTTTNAELTTAGEDLQTGLDLLDALVTPLADQSAIIVLLDATACAAGAGVAAAAAVATAVAVVDDFIVEATASSALLADVVALLATYGAAAPAGIVVSAGRDG